MKAQCLRVEGGQVQYLADFYGGYSCSALAATLRLPAHGRRGRGRATCGRRSVVFAGSGGGGVAEVVWLKQGGRGRRMAAPELKASATKSRDRDRRRQRHGDAVDAVRRVLDPRL